MTIQQHKRLHSTEYVPYAPDAVGAQINRNHEDCPAGLDTKARLYIKRTDGGVVAYCHHCGKSGFFVNGSSRIRAPKHVEVVREGAEYIKPTGWNPLVDGDPSTINGRELLKRRALMGLHELSLSFVEDPNVDGTPLLWGISDYHNNWVGHQYRWLDGRKPKTKTYLKSKPHSGGWYGGYGKICVIVEDPMSALMVQLHLGTKGRVHCLFGTNLSAEAQGYMANFDKIIVWTDPDAAGKKAAEEIVNRLRYRYPSKVIARYAGSQQPKDCTDLAVAVKEILSV